MEVCDLLIYTINDAILKNNYNKLDEIIKTDENLLIIANGKYDFSYNYIISLALKEIHSIVQKLYLTTRSREYKYILRCCERDLVKENRMLRREIEKLRNR